MLVLHFVPGVMHTFVWIIGLLLFVASSILIALCVLLTLHFFYEAVVLKRCMQSRAPRADVDPAADDLEVPAAEEPAAGDCVICDKCSNNKTMHYSVTACPCCHEKILSSANSQSACTMRCDKRTHNVPDCDDDEQCTLHSNHSGECLFNASDKAVEATDSEFEPEEDSSEAKIAGTRRQNAISLSFDVNVVKILKKKVTTVLAMCELFCFLPFACYML